MKPNKSLPLVLFVLFTAVVSCEIETEEPIPTYTLFTAASPTEGGSISASPSSGSYNAGQTVTLTPAPSTNWIFQQWEDDASGSASPLTLTMNSNKSVTGVFVKRDYPLNITIEGEGTVNEVIVTNPGGREYPHGTTVELTPVPAEGWVFESWGGDLSGSEVPQRITVDGEKNVTVVFKTVETGGGGVFYLADNGITCKCEEANPGDKGMINSVEYEAVDNELLRQRRDENADMTRLCTSLATDMSQLFFERDLNQAIGNWDVSNVANMRDMFNGSTFNQVIGDWDVSNVKYMTWMFYRSSFNQPIGDWDVGNVTDMTRMFALSPFNQPIGDWDISKVTHMAHMFWDSPFNQSIGDWDVSNVTIMSYMFWDSPFNQPIGDWDVSHVTNMEYIFYNSPFNQPIGNWDVRNVINMGGMFGISPFNQSIVGWDVSKVAEMGSMFRENADFNQDLSKWCVTKITTRPGNFRTGATAWVLPEPVWGTCPD